jgi:hypothetical protein
MQNFTRLSLSCSLAVTTKRKLKIKMENDFSLNKWWKPLIHTLKEWKSSLSQSTRRAPRFALLLPLLMTAPSFTLHPVLTIPISRPPSITSTHISMFQPEDEGTTFLRNVGDHLKDYTASQPTRPWAACALSDFKGFYKKQLGQLHFLGHTWVFIFNIMTLVVSITKKFCIK